MNTTMDLIKEVLHTDSKKIEIISAMVGASSIVDEGESSTNIYRRYIGEYVLVRSRNEGVNAGYVVAVDETGVILKDARRLWYHKPASKSASWYEGVACYGLSDDSKISNAVTEKAIVEDYSITATTATAEESIRGAKTNEQS